MRHAVMLVAILTFVPLTDATAQVGQPPIVRGERVRVTYHLCPPTHAGCFGPPQHYVGTFVTWNADTLVVESIGDTLAVPQDSVTTLEVRGQVSQAGVGSGIGGAIGAVIGAGMGAASCTDAGFGDSGTCALAGGLAFGIGGAMLGAIVGAITKTERWVSVPLNLTIRLQGTVTAADDGSPIPDASVGVFFLSWSSATPRDRPSASVRTDASGRYSLSFETEGKRCGDDALNISVTATRFQRLFLWFGTSDLRCTDELQTLDFQLERLTT